jgi:uncharacterized cupredoxin-like copper-binding protein
MFESQSAYGFVPPDINLSRDVGYKLTLDNPSGNSSKHYYTAADFYKTVVLRKADDTQAEIKAPYLKAVELLIEGSTTLFMVPTVDGVYDVLCTIPGHADLGMTGTVTVGEAPPGPVTSSEWVNSVNWNDKTVVDVYMVESGASLAFSPNSFTFEAGKPYVLRINNPEGNASKHYFSPEGLESFYQAVATRKIQTAEAEYKAPYFDAVELKIGGSLEIFFVPVLAGSGSHAVWTTAVDVAIGMEETQSSYGFVPPDIDLTSDVGYRLTLDNPAANTSKHYYTAADFYKTVVLRKADDTQAEIKAPYLKAVELLIDGSTTLYVVPTVLGTYGVLCTIPGHATLGMTGTITVNP